jgi:hypothetical protein
LPQVLFFSHTLSHPAREDKEEITQPVHILERPLADLFHPRKADDLALRPTTNRPALVQIAADLSPSGKDKGLERAELFLALIHELLESLYLPCPHPIHPFIAEIRGGGEFAP